MTILERYKNTHMYGIVHESGATQLELAQEAEKCSGSVMQRLDLLLVPCSK